MEKRFAIAAFCFVLLISSGAAAKSVSRVFVRENVSRAHREQLLNKLQKITGWSRLTFVADGALSVEANETIKGSKSARSLVTSAVSGSHVIVLEDASSRSDVAFCRVVPGRWTNGNAAGLDAHVVLIDFTDFDQIVGDAEARRSFDVGWAVLHEFDHVVMNSADTDVSDHVGECETHINKMRAELGLPLRGNYFFTASTLKADPNFNTRFVRLPFEQIDPSSRRLKRYWLTWDFTVVGGIPSSFNRLARTSADIF
jgi:hypothetical protein